MDLPIAQPAPSQPELDPRLYAAMLEYSCAFYAAETLRGPAEAPYNGRFLIAEHHEEWSRLITESKRLCVIAARDHGKSYLFTHAYPLWMAEKHPGKTGFIFSASQPQAERIILDIMAEVETNPRLRHLLPAKKVRWSTKCLQLANGHAIYARGYGTKVRGAHPIWIVVDDGLNDDTAFSERVRSKEIDYFQSAITNMVVPGGQIIVVGCVTLDTWISTGAGLKRIGDLCPGPLTPQTAYDLELPVYGRDGLRATSKFWVNGECATKRVTLARGYRLEGSHRHPLLVMGEDGIADWKRSDEVEPGDFVAVQAGAEVWGPLVDLRPFKAITYARHRNEIDLPDAMTPDLAYLLGLWTAEGSSESTGRVSISNLDEPIRTWLETHPFGMRFAANTTEGSEQTLRCSAKTFLDLIEWLGGKRALAPEKIVPTAIMSGDRASAIAFLQGYFDGDGNVSVIGWSQHVSVCTTSEQLARDVQQLLLNLGVVASLDSRPPQASERVTNPQHDAWSVRACGGDALWYMQEIGFRLPRKQAALVDMHDSARECGIPYQGALIARMRKEKPDRRKGRTLGVHAVVPPPFSLSQLARDQFPGAQRLETALAWFKKAGAQGPATDVFEANLAESRRGRVWLPVEKVEDSHAFTADFVIPDGHSFVSNGLVSHNTPFHRADLYAILAANTEYVFRRFPAVICGPNGKDRPLWPERYSMAALATRKREIGSIKFTREFLCSPISDGASLFPQYLFELPEVQQHTVTLGMCGADGNPRSFWHGTIGIQAIFAGVDFGLSSGIGADFTVIWVMGLDKRGNRWIIDIYKERGLDFTAQLNKIKDMYRRYKPGIIFCESNQAQRIFGKELQQNTDLPVYLYQTGDAKHSLEQGIPAIRTLLEGQKYRIPRGDARSVRLTNEWIDEMKAHTWDGGRVISVGEHDDMVMALWICERAIEKGAFAFSFAEEAGDEEAYNEVIGPAIRALSPGETEEEDDENFLLGAKPLRGGRPGHETLVSEDAIQAFMADEIARAGKAASFVTKAIAGVKAAQAKAQARDDVESYAVVRPELRSPQASEFIMYGGLGVPG